MLIDAIQRIIISNRELEFPHREENSFHQSWSPSYIRERFEISSLGVLIFDWNDEDSKAC